MESLNTIPPQVERRSLYGLPVESVAFGESILRRFFFVVNRVYMYVKCMNSCGRNPAPGLTSCHPA